MKTTIGYLMALFLLSASSLAWAQSTATAVQAAPATESSVVNAPLFDHPSGRARIEMAMRWRAEHPESAP